MSVFLGMCKWGYSPQQMWLWRRPFCAEKEKVSNNKKHVSTWSLQFCTACKNTCYKRKENLTETKEAVFGTPQMLPVSHPVCCISVVTRGWCVAKWGVCFCVFLWVYVLFFFLRMFVHMSLYTLRHCVCLVEGFRCCRAALPVTVGTTVWPSALSW